MKHRGRAKYLAEWRRNNRLSEWLHQRDAHARTDKAVVRILGVRVNWKAGGR